MSPKRHSAPASRWAIRRQAATKFGRENAPALTKWLVAGLAFMGITTGIVFLLIDVAKLPVALGTILAAEISTLLRFVINEFWVFGTREPTWSKLIKYHFANAGATAVWWIATNLLVLFHVNHLWASVWAVGASTFVSMGSNFLWVWRKPSERPDPAPDRP